MKKDTEKKTDVEPKTSAEDLGGMAIMVANRQADITSFSPEIQAALAQYDLRELVGIAPTWKPDKPGMCIVGTVVNGKSGVGKFAVGANGQKNMVLVIETPDGPFSIWASADLQMKLGNDVDRIIGRSFVIQFARIIPHSELPTKGMPMREYRVIEVRQKVM